MDATKLKDLADEALADLNDAVRAEVRNRQPKATLDSIKPRMSKEQRAGAVAAIQQAGEDLYGR